MPPISERHVRLQVGQETQLGRLVGDQVELDNGQLLAVSDVEFLAPVAPTKIIGVHLSYRSRVVEYQARIPAEPSYFMKPLTTLNGHLQPVKKASGSRFLNYEGELAVVIGRRMK